MSIETDKRTEQFNIRIPEILKDGLDGLTPKQKTDLYEKVLIILAKAVHESKFNPMIYLKSDDFNTQ